MGVFAGVGAIALACLVLYTIELSSSSSSSSSLAINSDGMPRVVFFASENGMGAEALNRRDMLPLLREQMERSKFTVARFVSGDDAGLGNVTSCWQACDEAPHSPLCWSCDHLVYFIYGPSATVKGSKKLKARQSTTLLRLVESSALFDLSPLEGSLNSFMGILNGSADALRSLGPHTANVSLAWAEATLRGSVGRGGIGAGFGAQFSCSGKTVLQFGGGSGGGYDPNSAGAGGGAGVQIPGKGCLGGGGGGGVSASGQSRSGSSPDDGCSGISPASIKSAQKEIETCFQSGKGSFQLSGGAGWGVNGSKGAKLFGGGVSIVIRWES